MNKKGQIKIFENIGVLLMFFLIVVISIVFYFVFSRGEMQEAQIQLSTQNAVELSSKIALLPELQCRKNNAQEDHCLDKLKITALATTLLNAQIQEEYYDIFGFSIIKVISLYPSTFDVTIYENPLQNFKNRDTFFIPVSLFDPIYDEYNYGILEVNVYT